MCVCTHTNVFMSVYMLTGVAGTNGGGCQSMYKSKQISYITIQLNV